MIIFVERNEEEVSYERGRPKRKQNSSALLTHIRPQRSLTRPRSHYKFIAKGVPSCIVDERWPLFITWLQRIIILSFCFMDTVHEGGHLFARHNLINYESIGGNRYDKELHLLCLLTNDLKPNTSWLLQIFPIERRY